MEEINEMKGFDGVVGHQEIISHLQNAIRLERYLMPTFSAGNTGQAKNCWPLCLP